MTDYFFQYVDDHKDEFIKRLAAAVSKASVSAGPLPGKRVRPMGEWLKTQLEDLKVDTKLVELSTDPNILPPLVVGRVGDNDKLQTVLVYGHYDVQPADEEGWRKRNPDAPKPFLLTALPKNKPVKLVGRGSTDDKGPLTGWLNVLQAHSKGDFPPELPVNIRFLFEGMEEAGDGGKLDEWITNEKEGYLKGVDYICITDTYWLTTRGPSLTYGLRGVIVLTAEVTGGIDDLHSGMYGRVVNEPLIDLIKLLGKLVDTNGVITIPGVEKQPSPEEVEEAWKIGYSVDDLVQDLRGGQFGLTQDPVKLLLGRTRYPSLSIHNIEGGRDGTIISRQVKGTFSIRLVEPQDPDKIATIVQEYLYSEFDKLGTRNTLKVKYLDGARPWVGDKNSDNYKAADAAVHQVYGTAPVYTLEGGSIPLAHHLETTLEKNVALLPMGKSDDGAHSLSEKLDIENYVKGTKLYGAYLYEIAKLPKP